MQTATSLAKSNHQLITWFATFLNFVMLMDILLGRQLTSHNRIWCAIFQNYVMPMDTLLERLSQETKLFSIWLLILGVRLVDHKLEESRLDMLHHSSILDNR